MPFHKSVYICISNHLVTNFEVDATALTIGW